MDKLKPCPFCGGSPKIRASDPYGAFYTDVGTVVYFGRKMTHKMIVCSKCGMKTKPYLTDRGLYKEWNRRAENG